MPTTADWIEEVKRHVYSGYVDGLNRLDGAVDASTTSVNLDFDPTGLTAGGTVAVDLEEMHVWSLNARTLTVRRGHNGSTAASHLDEALVHIKPKFSSFRILQALNATLREMSGPQSGLFQMLTADVSYNPSRIGYDLPGSVQSIYSVTYDDLGSDNAQPRVKKWSFSRDQPTGDFPSGQVLRLLSYVPSGRDVRVQYRAPYGTLSSLTDDVETVTGVQDFVLDIAPLGAALRLVPPRDVKKSFGDTQGEPRRASEAPTGTSRQASAGLAVLYQTRLLAAATHLQSLYPYQKAG